MTEADDYKIIDHVVCDSGLKLSVQASDKHYCVPQNNAGPYTNVEVCSYDILIPNWPDPIFRYNEVTGIPENVTYYNASSEALMKLVYNHGGIKNGKLPKLIL